MVQVEFANVTSYTNPNITEIFPNTTKGTFFPQVDIFSQMLISNTGLLYKNETNVYVFVNHGGVISEKRYYKRADFAGLFVGSFTAVITISNGNVTGITWDDGCSQCTSSCIETKTCGLSYNDVDCVANTGLCNISVYLAWVGTDSNGATCNSLSYIPSKFASYSLGPVYQTAAGVATSRYNF